MINLIFMSIYILTIVIIYFTNNILAKPNKNVILNTTLLYSKLNDASVLEIVKNYKKANLYTCMFCLLITFPSLFIDLTFLTITYLYIWIFIVVIINGLVMKKYTDMLRKLKSNNEWFYNTKHIVRIDTEISRQKKKMIFSKLWFIPVIIINLITLFISYNLNMIIPSISGLFSTIVCIVFYFIVSNKALIVYSEKSELNYACNSIYKRVWSLLWILISYISSAYTFIICIDINHIIAATAFICSIIPIIIFICHLHIRNTQNNLLNFEKDVFYTDDDDYWGAFFYNNPNDRKFFVDDRTGIGITINMGHPISKPLSIIFTIFILAIVVSSVGLSISADFADINLTTSNNTIQIKASTYNLSFDKSDIENISIINSMPDKGTRTNGIGTDKFLIGHFNYNNYGKCMVFRNKDSGNNIILIKLNDKYVFLSGDTPEETEQFYNCLK